MVKKLLVGSFVFSAALQAQHLDFGFDFGVKGGFPFTNLLQSTSVLNVPPPTLQQTGNYLVGPAIEMRFPFGFAIEVDGIYRGASTQLTVSGGVPTAFSSSSWEIPYLAKFRFPIPVIKPFVSGGGAYRTFDSLPNGVTATHNAFVAGGGLEMHISHIRLSGEVRYLHWGSPPSNVGVRLAQSQGEVLFGLMFQPRTGR
jgi:Outer membrane protein beta-barrel domain